MADKMAELRAVSYAGGVGVLDLNREMGVALLQK